MKRIIISESQLKKLVGNQITEQAATLTPNISQSTLQPTTTVNSGTYNPTTTLFQWPCLYSH